MRTRTVTCAALPLLLAALTLAGCDSDTPPGLEGGTKAPAVAVAGPPAPDPAEIGALEERAADERRRRFAAEEATDLERGRREAWQLGALGLGLLAVVGFIAGTSIGSGGRRYAS